MSVSSYISRCDSDGTLGFLSCIQPDLEAIETRLEREITSDVRRVCQISGHILTAGGKRLRPAMVALSARAIDPNADSRRIESVGASVELVHMATLVHDDVVDNTATRRGKPTANAVFGNGAAVLAGDFLLARSMRLLAIDGDLRVIRTVSEITIEMSEGEVMEIAATGDPQISEEHYFDILGKKTASFVDGCCRAGAMVGGASEQQEGALAEYGYRLGMAFQIADDLLDYTGDPQITGKPIGSDLRDGRATLPFLLALKKAQSADRDRILAAFGNASLEDAAIGEVVEILDRYGVFDEARKEATAHVERADQALNSLPPTPAKDCFRALTDFVVQRDR